MKHSIVHKLIASHLVGGELEPGDEISIHIDQTLTQDATGTIAYLQYEAMGGGSVKTDLSVSYVDHNTIQAGFENADDHRYLRSIAEKFGIYFSRAGNGICHQVHLERFSRPGATLLGSDSHTPTAGGAGMFAIGAGGLDVALAMAGKPFTLTCPAVTLVKLKKRLQPWVTAKDVILWLLRELTSKGNVGTAVEYGGSGVKNLSVPERATMTNMGAELGVTTSVFPSDRVTERFLKAQARQEYYTPLSADPGCGYDRVLNLDLSAVEPLVAAPHNPDNVRTAAEMKGTAVDQVCIGSCTNSSYKDLMRAARMLEGRKIAGRVSLVLAPGSRQVLDMIAHNGALETIIAAGARVAEPACGFCIGNSQAPHNEAVSVRTSNRNFLGRSGTRSANVYLASVETAVAAAIAGEFIDPRSFGPDACPAVREPASFAVDDSMIVPPLPEKDRNTITIQRGPNIGDPPRNEKLPDSLKGSVQIKVGDKITTDHIMPAGRLLKYRSNIKKYSRYVFSPVDETFSKRCAEAKEHGLASFITAGESYGQGSSREHAALCPMYLGVKAVIARSYERIHSDNLLNFGILPLIFKNPGDYEKIDQGDEITLENLRESVNSGRFTLNNATKGITIPLECPLSDRRKAMVLAGGALNLISEEQ
ncbi:MAG: aconitate hydratase [Kiritimatiellia bacterium]